MPTDATGHDVEYFGRVIERTAHFLAGHDVTFVLTWDLDSIPETGKHVVAIVQGDEDARIPLWANKVLATFKCYGVRPPWMPIGARPSAIDALEVLHFARRMIAWTPAASRVAIEAARRRRGLPSIFAVPLGYYNQDARPIRPPAERRWFVSFAGSGLATSSTTGLGSRIGTPKERSRTAMHQALRRVTERLPPDSVEAVARSRFPTLLPGQDQWARGLTATYSDLLAETAICLVPRGNSPETFRFFEALRAGCVVICEPLPDHWFYRGSPAITVRNWNELPDIVSRLFDSPEEVADIHERSLEWWRTRCSEEAVATLIATHIASLRGSAALGSDAESRSG
jgi:hypothetical protein